MTHFALICPPFHSHVRAFEVLGAALKARGHRVTLFAFDGAVTGEGLGVAALPVTAGGPSVSAIVERAGRATGPLGILRTVRDTASLTDALCRGAPEILRAIGAEAIVGDEMEPAVGLIAAHLGLPFLSIACALPIERDPNLPSPFIDWSYDPTPAGRKRNRGGERIARLFLRRQRALIEEWSLRFALPVRSRMEDCASPIATLAQLPATFDFPRAATSRVRHVGPLRYAVAAREPLPFVHDPARPLVYASLGTLQGHRLATFRVICRAARRLGVQLVISHCGGLTAAEAASLDALHIADFLPQRSVLAVADACITHAGLNTALDALEHGVPMLAIPIAFDQPGVAARIEHHGVGLKLSRVLLSERAVRTSLRRLIEDKGFRERARAIGASMERMNGAAEAAEIIEHYLAAPVPVPEAAE